MVLLGAFLLVTDAIKHDSATGLGPRSLLEFQINQVVNVGLNSKRGTGGALQLLGVFGISWDDSCRAYLAGSVLKHRQI